MENNLARRGFSCLAGLAALVLLNALPCLGCGATEASGDAMPTSGSPRDPTLGDGATSGTGANINIKPGAPQGTAEGESALPPEVELEASFEAPVATGDLLWSANPSTGRVALVNAANYQVETRSAGHGPTFVARVPEPEGGNADRAIVLNVLSRDATLLSATRPAETFSTHLGANSWAVSPSGRWALAWTDVKRVAAPKPTDGYQDASLILVRPSATESAAPRVTRHGRLGFRPTSITFDATETHAYLVTSDGISVLDLSSAATPNVSSLIEVGDPLEDVARREVVISPDGALAVVRRDNSTNLSVIQLATNTKSEISLPSAVTDLDITADGSLVVAVLRSSSQLAVLPVSSLLATTPKVDLVDLEGVFGSVSLARNGRVAVAYTNATPSEVVAVIDLRPGDTYLQHRVEGLKAPVQAVLVAEDGNHAIALLGKAAGSATPGAFALLSTTRKLAAKIVSTDAAPQAVAIEPGEDSRLALVSVRDDTGKKFGVYAADLATLQVDRLPLTSPPVSLGLLPELGKGYVAQSHPEGRITFLEFPDPSALASGTSAVPKARTLTGFELAAKVTYPAN